MATFNESVRINNSLHVSGTISPARPRSELASETSVVYPIDLGGLKVWDSYQPLPATAAADDLGLIHGTWGTGAPYLRTIDFKNTTTTAYARFMVPLPAEYVAAGAVTLRFSGGMLTTVASSACTLDCEAYINGRDMTIDGSDICATAAQSINSLTFADKSFTITPTDLAAGDMLDVRITITGTDSATATVVAGIVGAAELLCTVRG